MFDPGICFAYFDAIMLNHITTADSHITSSASISPSTVRLETDRLIVKTAEVLHGRNEIWIEHGTEMYRLRLTRAGKLLLSK
jgi:hemin uptake protein HemP